MATKDVMFPLAIAVVYFVRIRPTVPLTLLCRIAILFNIGSVPSPILHGGSTNSQHGLVPVFLATPGEDDHAQQ